MNRVSFKISKKSNRGLYNILFFFDLFEQPWNFLRYLVGFLGPTPYEAPTHNPHSCGLNCICILLAKLSQKPLVDLCENMHWFFAVFTLEISRTPENPDSWRKDKNVFFTEILVPKKTDFPLIFPALWLCVEWLRVYLKTKFYSNWMQITDLKVCGTRCMKWKRQYETKAKFYIINIRNTCSISCWFIDCSFLCWVQKFWENYHIRFLKRCWIWFQNFIKM